MTTVELLGRGGVLLDGVRLTPERSLRLRNHSPTGFAWGYGGSGPAQLALAILLEHTGSEVIATRHYQQFKRDHVATWPWVSGAQTFEVDIDSWIRTQTKGDT